MLSTTQKIVPHLWFDQEAVEAVAFYTSIFPDSVITGETIVHDTPSGDVADVSFQLWGQKFMAINGGPHFTFNPAVSFFVNVDPSRETNAEEKVQHIWDYLSQEGKVLMPLGTYPFSKKYGWIQDKYGVSWQVMLTNPDGDERPSIVPSLMFIGDNCGKAEEAIRFYTSIFLQSKQGHLAHYPKGMEPDKEGTLMFADFMLEKSWFAAMDSAHTHKFQFNEAISFMVYCEDQKELDMYWDSLSAVPKSEQCGWLKDKYGLSWQIVSNEIMNMLSEGTPEQIASINEATFKMKKLDIATLRKAYEKGLS